jgi:hypothetical protein
MAPAIKGGKLGGFVIPGRREAANPESRTTRTRPWIPGPARCAVPE